MGKQSKGQLMGIFSSSSDSRRADGKPETAKDKKFFDLRESGFTGPIDHNGNPVDDVLQWIRDHSR
jgi:hypothetical protein